MVDFALALRKKAVEKRFNQFVKECPQFYVLDTETTGLDPEAEACEISVIDQDGKIVIDTQLNPSVPISDGAAAVHGIRDVEHCPKWGEIAPQIFEKLENKTVLIYNAAYDLKILKNCNKHYGIDRKFNATAKCVMLPVSHWVGDWNEYHGNFRWVKLETIASRLKLDLSNIKLHRALGDCQLTLAVVKELAKRGERWMKT